MFSFMEMVKSLTPFFTAAVVIVLSPFVKERIPSAVSNFLVSTFKMWLDRFCTPHITVVIEEKGELKSNQIYEAARAHLHTLISDSTKPKRFKVSKEDRQKESTIDIIKDVDVIDYYREIKLKWKLRTEKEPYHSSIIKKYFELSFDKGYEMDVLDSYLDDIVDRYKRIQKNEKVVRIYTCDERDRGRVYCDHDRERNVRWSYVNLEHPATFEKLAIDPEQKEMIKDDLDGFLGRKDLYEKVGKAWKRGYLLYGPPGTGKSSLIAAMANYLKFNIYDVNLSGVLSNEDLRSILLSTTDRSILVFEDIDCITKIYNGPKKQDYTFTISGLLNIMDGLWSSCGDERIIVFTTSHKDSLDPALLRPGRMDMHVHMSYCTMDGFKLLSSNYLDIEGDHQLYRQIEGLLENVEVTPAEIAEELLKSGGTDVVLGGLVKFLKQKTLQKAKAAEMKELLKSDDDTDVDVEGFVKFLVQEKLKKAKAAEAEQLLKRDHTDADADVDVEGLVKLFKQKKLEDAMAAEAKCINPKESKKDGSCS